MSILDIRHDTETAGPGAVGDSGDIGAGGAVVAIHGAVADSVTLVADTDDLDLDADSDAMTIPIAFAGFALNGLLAPEVDGEIKILRAVSAGTISHEAASSTAANRFLCPGDADVALSIDSAITVAYLAAAARWQVVGGAGGGGSIDAEDLATSETDRTLVLRPNPPGTTFGAEAPQADAGDMDSAITLDPAILAKFYGTLTTDLTITLASPTVSRDYMEFVIDTGDGGFAIEDIVGSGSTGFVWNGPAPTLPTEADTIFRLAFEYDAIRDQWIGDLIGGGGVSFGPPDISYGSPAEGGSGEAIQTDATFTPPDASEVPADSSGFDNSASDTVQDVLADFDAAISAAGGGAAAGAELLYAEKTSDTNVTATTSATANTILDMGSHTFDGTACILDIEGTGVTLPTTAGIALRLLLTDGGASGTRLGALAIIQTPSGGSAMRVPISRRYRFTPSAGSHDYVITAMLSSSGTGVVLAGAGGTGTENLPFSARITKA